MSRMDYVNWQEASDDLNEIANAASNRVIDAIESGRVPLPADVAASGLCPECLGFGFLDYEDDGFTEIPCSKCKSTSTV